MFNNNSVSGGLLQVIDTADLGPVGVSPSLTGLVTHETWKFDSLVIDSIKLLSINRVKLTINRAGTLIAKKANGARDKGGGGRPADKYYTYGNPWDMRGLTFVG